MWLLVWTFQSHASTSAAFRSNDWLDADSVTNNGSAWFDANGNTRTNGTATYLYDWANRLTNGPNVTNIVYDANGNRVKKVAGGTTTLYLVSTVNPSGFAQVMEELTVNGSTTNLACAYVYGLDLISQRQPTVTTNFYGFDGLGSVRFLLNLAGGLAGTNAFDAWGNLIASTGTITNRYLFAGEQWDADLGLYYNRARYWSPNVGRFWTMDSFEGNNSDPLSLHKYLYAHASPVTMVDPSGHEGTYVSISFTMAIIGQVNSMYLMSSSKALGAAQTISGSTEFSDLIWGLEAASIVQDKVSLVLAGAGITMATAKIANFLANNAYKFANASVNTLGELRVFASKPESYYSYKELYKMIGEAGLRETAQHGLGAHHLVEKMFASKIGTAEEDIIAVALTPISHYNQGSVRVALGGNVNIHQRIMSRLSEYGVTVPTNASVEQIWKAHRSVYDDIGHPEWAEAIYEAYFKSKGISFY